MSPSVTQFCPAFVLMLSLLERRAVCSCETKPTIHCNKGTQEVVYLTLTLITTSVSVWLLLVFRQHFLHKQVSSVLVTLTAFSLLLHNSYLRSLRSNSASHCHGHAISFSFCSRVHFTLLLWFTHSFVHVFSSICTPFFYPRCISSLIAFLLFISSLARGCFSLFETLSLRFRSVRSIRSPLCLSGSVQSVKYGYGLLDSVCFTSFQ